MAVGKRINQCSCCPGCATCPIGSTLGISVVGGPFAGTYTAAAVPTPTCETGTWRWDVGGCTSGSEITITCGANTSPSSVWNLSLCGGGTVARSGTETTTVRIEEDCIQCGDNWKGSEITITHGCGCECCVWPDEDWSYYPALFSITATNLVVKNYAGVTIAGPFSTFTFSPTGSPGLFGGMGFEQCPELYGNSYFECYINYECDTTDGYCLHIGLSSNGCPEGCNEIYPGVDFCKPLSAIPSPSCCPFSVDFAPDGWSAVHPCGPTIEADNLVFARSSCPESGGGAGMGIAPAVSEIVTAPAKRKLRPTAPRPGGCGCKTKGGA